CFCVCSKIESGEPDISCISLGERDNEDGDVEMKQTEVSPVNNASLGSSSLGIQLPNAPAVSSGSVSSSSTVSRNPVDVAKSLVTKRDHYLSLLNDMIVGTADDDDNGQQHMVEIRNKIEELNRTISTIKHSVKLSGGEMVTASIKGVSAGSSNATTGGISLSKRDLPKFQLKSDSVKYFHGEESFDSIFHFLAVFEKVVSSSGQDVESAWKRYLPLTIPYEYDMWLKQKLLLVNTWKEAKDAFVKKFNSSLHRLSARRAVQSSVMQGGETTEQYLNRFSRSCVEAGYDSNDTSIPDAFLNGFPTDWQIQITALLCNTFPGQDSWTTNQVADAATNILGNVKRRMSFVGRAAEANSNNSKGASGGGKFGGQQQGYRAKRENTQNSESTFSRDKEGGKRNVPSGATTV
ncbi:hypothetical protein PS6_011709, partial [Mucor atramentarius]